MVVMANNNLVGVCVCFGKEKTATGVWCVREREREENNALIVIETR